MDEYPVGSVLAAFGSAAGMILLPAGACLVGSVLGYLASGKPASEMGYLFVLGVGTCISFLLSPLGWALGFLAAGLVMWFWLDEDGPVEKLLGLAAVFAIQNASCFGLAMGSAWSWGRLVLVSLALPAAYAAYRYARMEEIRKAREIERVLQAEKERQEGGVTPSIGMLGGGTQSGRSQQPR